MQKIARRNEQAAAAAPPPASAVAEPLSLKGTPKELIADEAHHSEGRIRNAGK